MSQLFRIIRISIYLVSLITRGNKTIILNKTKSTVCKKQYIEILGKKEFFTLMGFSRFQAIEILSIRPDYSTRASQYTRRLKAEFNVSFAVEKLHQ